ncbi:MAG: hypothetical protein WAR60_10565, partial [Candidatus Microthrix parvicella]
MDGVATEAHLDDLAATVHLDRLAGEPASAGSWTGSSAGSVGPGSSVVQLRWATTDLMIRSASSSSTARSGRSLVLLCISVWSRP